MYRYFLSALVLLLGWFSPAYSAETHYIGIIPFYAPEKIWNLYSPLVEYLNRNSGTRWELKLYHKHDAVLEGICSGEISIALLGPVPFARALDKCRVRPLLVALGSDGKPSYRSIIVTHDNEVNSLEDVKNREFGFFEGSTAAHILPRKLLEENGITPDMIKPVFLKGQDKIMEALLKHEIAAAGVKESLYNKFKGENIKILKASEPVPNFVFCAFPGLDTRTEKKFVKALLKLRPASNPGHRNLVQGWDDEVKNGFIIPPKTYSQDSMKLMDSFRKYAK